MKRINSLDDYRCKLIDKVLKSNSFEEIKRYLLTAIKSLEKHKINGHLVGRFVDKTLYQLNRLSSHDMDSKQSSNVRYAKSQLETFKNNKVGITRDYVSS